MSFTAKNTCLPWPFDGVPELIRQIKAGGFKVGLATTCQPDELKVYLDKLGIDSLISMGSPVGQMSNTASRILTCLSSGCADSVATHLHRSRWETAHMMPTPPAWPIWSHLE